MSRFHYFSNCPSHKTGKKFITFVFRRGKKFVFLAEIFTLDSVSAHVCLVLFEESVHVNVCEYVNVCMCVCGFVRFCACEEL